MAELSKKFSWKFEADANVGRFCSSFQLFALQGESSKHKKSEEIVHHKLPAYVQHMDRLGDTELWGPTFRTGRTILLGEGCF